MRVVPSSAAVVPPVHDLAVMPAGANVPMLVIDQAERRWVCEDVDGGALEVPVPDGAIVSRPRGRVAARREAGLTLRAPAAQAALLSERAQQAPQLVERYIEWRKAR